MKIEIDERKIEKAMRAGGATVLLVGAAVLICGAHIAPDVLSEVSVPQMLCTLLALIGCMFAYLFITRETR